MPWRRHQDPLPSAVSCRERADLTRAVPRVRSVWMPDVPILRSFEKVNVASDPPAVREMAHQVRAMWADHADDVAQYMTYRCQMTDGGFDSHGRFLGVAVWINST